MTALRTGTLATVGIASLATLLLSAPQLASAAPSPSPNAPCYNGIAPINPYINNCAIPHRPPHILGAAPDQTAIINCSVGSRLLRAVCLSQYVNGGPYASIGIG